MKTGRQLPPLLAALLCLAFVVPAGAEKPSLSAAAVAKKPIVETLSAHPAPPTPTQGIPTQLKAPTRTLRDWYCGPGSGPGGHAVCTQELIATCTGKYHPPGELGPHHTWGTCHES